MYGKVHLERCPVNVYLNDSTEKHILFDVQKSRSCSMYRKVHLDRYTSKQHHFDSTVIIHVYVCASRLHLGN